MSSSGPPNQAVLESQRKLRQNEVAAQAVFRRLAVYALFVFVVFSIGYINRDARSYNIRRNLDNAIYFTTKQTFGFESVRSTNYLYLKIIGDGILKKISYVLKSVLVWSLKVCK